MSELLTQETYGLLEECFDSKIENFTVTVHAGNKKGDGFLGDMLYVSLKNKQTNKDHHVVIKQVLASKLESTITFMSLQYTNEIYFYTKILPALQAFQKQYPLAIPFNNVPKCFGTSSVRGKEKIVLENLKFENYELHPKTKYVTTAIYEEIFKLYGKYHAISFAFQKLDNESFLKLVSTLRNNWLVFAASDMFSKGIKMNLEKVKKVLTNLNEEEMKTKLKKYIDNGLDIFKEVVNYTGSYGVILHGDDWSNNMMFKYDESKKIEDIKLIDFQLTNLGSPVHDLSYTFYSGADKSTLDNLDNFLRIYHTSLNESLKHYGLDAENVYPYDVFEKEWKKFCRFGFIMGCMIWNIKNVEEGHIPDLGDVMDKKSKVDEYNFNVIGKEYEKSVHNLVKHMHENNFL